MPPIIPATRASEVVPPRAINLPAFSDLGRVFGGLTKTGGPVRRAINNLKSVLFNKLSEGPDAKTALEVAALIDEAAQKIERLGA